MFQAERTILPAGSTASPQTTRTETKALQAAVAAKDEKVYELELTTCAP